MSEKLPAISVVIPLYNAERFIADALRSVRQQTFADYEVLVVDDGSTDAGPSIAAEFAREDQRVRIVHQANRGLPGARNSGIREARGRYIALLDADDIWLPGKLELHFAHLEARVDVGVSYAPSRFIDDDGRPMRASQRPALRDIDAEHVFCRNPVGNGSAAVLRRAALDDIQFVVDAPEGPRICWFDESFRQSEDIEAWTRIAATTAWRFEGLEEPLTLYRVNAGGLSANVDQQLATWRRFKDKVAGYAPGLVQSAGRRAEGYQLRYLARRAAVSGNAGDAKKLILSSFAIYPAAILEEPRKTLEAIALTGVAWFLPGRAFVLLRDMMLTARPHSG